MSFVIFSDGTANLPEQYRNGIELLPCRYIMDDQEYVYTGELESFNAKDYYDKIRAGSNVKTSLINTRQFMDAFTPFLEKGEDIIYISMASGISGTYQAAVAAKEELAETFPARTVRIIDSKTCGMGTGLQVQRARELQLQGLSAVEAADILDAEVLHYCSYFTVDNVKYLIHTGRVSAAVAAAVNFLDIKPILLGNSTGNITICGQCRGRKRSLDMLAQKYRQKVIDASEHIVAISNGDCEEDAKKLAEMIKKIAEPKEIVILPHEPFSGGHVGPGMLGLFFYGTDR